MAAVLPLCVLYFTVFWWFYGISAGLTAAVCVFLFAAPILAYRENQRGRIIGKEFVEWRGVLFKRTDAGRFHQVPFCPTCRGGMFSLQDVAPYHCSRCNFFADFTGKDLHRIISEVDSGNGRP